MTLRSASKGARQAVRLSPLLPALAAGLALGLLRGEAFGITVQGVEFRQIDFYGNNVPAVVDTDWGDFEISLASDGDPNAYFLNLIIRKDGQSPEFWVIQNMALPSSPTLSGSTAIGQFFSLADIRDGSAPVTSLEYSIDLSTVPLEFAPAPGAFAAAAVLDGLFDAEGVGNEGSTGPPNDPGPPPQRVAQAPPQPAARVDVFRKDVPDLEEGIVECAPVAVARSLRWLHNNMRIDLGAKTDAQIVDDFKAASNWARAAGGVPTAADILRGKLKVARGLVDNKFMAVRGPTNSIPAGDFRTPDGTAVDRGNDPTFAFIKEQIDAGEDVELALQYLDTRGFLKNGHVVTVIGYSFIPGTYQAIWFQDDEHQGRPDRTNRRRSSRYFDPRVGPPLARPRLFDFPNNFVGLVVSESPLRKEACRDGADNDGDGLVDLQDPDCQPLLVALASFEARPGPRGITLTWSTASEVDNAGFLLLRGESPTGPFRRITPFLIPAKGSAASGTAYTYDDLSVRRRRTYHYVLVDVDITGRETRHGPVAASVGPPKPARRRR